MSAFVFFMTSSRVYAFPNKLTINADQSARRAHANLATHGRPRRAMFFWIK